MKKTIVMVAALMAACALSAQETLPYSFTAEAGVGLTYFVGRPALSLAADGQAERSALTSSVTVGLSNNVGTFGLRYSMTPLQSTSTKLHEVSLLYQRSVQVTPRVELFGGVSAGMTVATGESDLDGKQRWRYRYGLTAGVEMGVRYQLCDWASLYASVGLSSTHALNSKAEMPSDFARQVHGSAAAVRTSGGISIGIRPKKETLHMPDQLVRNNLPLQLACYEE